MAAVAGLVSGCADPKPSTEPTIKRELEKLEKLAEQDCMCRMAGLETSILRDEFERLTHGREQTGSATSSIPVSYEIVCFPDLGETACISAGGYLPPNSDNFICSEAQAMELETVWSAVQAGGRGSIEESGAAMLARLEGMRAEVSGAEDVARCRGENQAASFSTNSGKKLGALSLQPGAVAAASLRLWRSVLRRLGRICGNPLAAQKALGSHGRASAPSSLS